MASRAAGRILVLVGERGELAVGVLDAERELQQGGRHQPCECKALAASACGACVLRTCGGERWVLYLGRYALGAGFWDRSPGTGVRCAMEYCGIRQRLTSRAVVW